MDIITINYGCNVRWEADKKWCLGIHLALVNLPVAASSWSPIQTDYFMPDLLDAWEGERAAVFFPLSSLLPPEREKSMGGHKEAIGYVCVGEKQAQLTWALFISALRSPPPEGPWTHRPHRSRRLCAHTSLQSEQESNCRCTSVFCGIFIDHLCSWNEPRVSHVSDVQEAHHLYVCGGTDCYQHTHKHTSIYGDYSNDDQFHSKHFLKK